MLSCHPSVICTGLLCLTVFQSAPLSATVATGSAGGNRRAQKSTTPTTSPSCPERETVNKTKTFLRDLFVHLCSGINKTASLYTPVIFTCPPIRSPLLSMEPIRDICPLPWVTNRTPPNAWWSSTLTLDP